MPGINFKISLLFFSILLGESIFAKDDLSPPIFQAILKQDLIDVVANTILNVFDNGDYRLETNIGGFSNCSGKKVGTFTGHIDASNFELLKVELKNAKSTCEKFPECYIPSKQKSTFGYWRFQLFGPSAIVFHVDKLQTNFSLAAFFKLIVDKSPKQTVESYELIQENKDIQLIYEGPTQKKLRIGLQDIMVTGTKGTKIPIKKRKEKISNRTATLTNNVKFNLNYLFSHFDLEAGDQIQMRLFSGRGPSPCLIYK
ncbi:MAG: hypothetical protein HYV97_01270 [Bdellovibrio sp.]|nr:hypothetical protein [Bdellovibrio sp.]